MITYARNAGWKVVYLAGRAVPGVHFRLRFWASAPGERPGRQTRAGKPLPELRMELRGQWSWSSPGRVWVKDDLLSIMRRVRELKCKRAVTMVFRPAAAVDRDSPKAKDAGQGSAMFCSGESGSGGK